MPEEESTCFVMIDEISLRVHLPQLEGRDVVAGFADNGDGDRRPVLKKTLSHFSN